MFMQVLSAAVRRKRDEDIALIFIRTLSLDELAGFKGIEYLIYLRL